MAVIRDIPSAGFRKNKKVRVSPRGGLRILESGLPVTHESVHHDCRHAIYTVVLSILESFRRGIASKPP